jgi:hypothetical protein
MMLSAFVVAQIVFDVVVVALAALYFVSRKTTPPAPEPPDWYPQLVRLGQDLMTATEPMLDKLETREPPEAVAAPAPDRYEEARELLRAGARPDDVAGRAGLLPGEMKLLANIVAAETRVNGRARPFVPPTFRSG